MDDDLLMLEAAGALNSAKAKLQSPPSAPINLVGVDDGNSGAQLTWSAPSTGPVTGYKVYSCQQISGSGHETLYQTLGNVLSYDDVAANGASNFYQVSAFNAAGEGPKSNEVLVHITSGG